MCSIPQVPISSKYNFSYECRGFPKRKGGDKIFFSDFGIFVMRIARGVRGHAPPRNFFKTVQFGAF